MWNNGDSCFHPEHSQIISILRCCVYIYIYTTYTIQPQELAQANLSSWVHSPTAINGRRTSVLPPGGPGHLTAFAKPLFIGRGGLKLFVLRPRIAAWLPWLRRPADVLRESYHLPWGTRKQNIIHPNCGLGVGTCCPRWHWFINLQQLF